MLGTRTYTFKKKDKEFSYVDDPAKLIELKKTHTYKEIAEMYRVSQSKIFIDIKHYKENLLKKTNLRREN